MRLTFLHAADLHLGSPLVGLSGKDPARAAQLAAASRDAFSDLVTQAIEQAVAFVVIAGDVFDGDWRDMAIGLFFNKELARLEREGIPVYLLKGNHDADSQISKTLTLPGNVHVFPHRKPGSFELPDYDLVLHGQSFAQRDVRENLAAAYPPARPGWCNIGVLHTACTGRPGHDAYAPCTPDDLARLGYEYWALGHIHAFEIVGRDPWIVYPGNLQGRSVRECGPKGAVLVDLFDGRVDDVRRLVLDKIRWAEVTVDLGGLADEQALLTQIADQLGPVIAAAEGRPLALRVRLGGTTPLHRHLLTNRERFEAEIEAVADRWAADLWLESLHLDTREPARTTQAPDEFDPAALIDAALADPDFRALADDELDRMGQKLLRYGPLAADLPQARDALLAEARALVLARLGVG